MAVNDLPRPSQRYRSQAYKSDRRRIHCHYSIIYFTPKTQRARLKVVYCTAPRDVITEHVIIAAPNRDVITKHVIIAAPSRDVITKHVIIAAPLRDAELGGFHQDNRDLRHVALSGGPFTDLGVRETVFVDCD
jgi:hypothetical protein